jgi:phosphoglycolate phosphatase
MRAAVLLDIDGTLLRTSGAGVKALTHALAVELGVSDAVAVEAIGALDFRGATDRSIMQRLSVALDTPLEPYQEALLRRYFTALERYLTELPVETLPGVNELLATLHARGDVYVGILTGNFRNAARLKLGAIGHAALTERAGGFGEDGIHRHELAVVARDRLHAAGIDRAARIIVVGDTEHDVTCGKHIRALTVAVGTGWTPWETLRAAEPDLMLRDLSEPGALLQLLE